MQTPIFILLLVLLFAAVGSTHQYSKAFSSQEEAKRFNDVAQQIRDYVLKGPAKGESYEKLAYMVDAFGPRLLGSDILETVIDWLGHSLKNDSFENVHHEEVKGILHWTRGEERLDMILPRTISNLRMIGLGGSVGTGPQGITGDVLVVNSFDDLEAKRDSVKGKIVVYNAPFVSYGQTVGYRVSGASRAARYGAIAALVRSVTPYSIGSPHTGIMAYDNDIPKIPTAAITIEDAEMMARMQGRGWPIRLRLSMGAQRHDNSTRSSRNTIGEIVGSTYPEQVVVLGGHIDSWDAGPQCGSMDDGAGIFVTYEAVRILKALGLRPKRTIRFVAWTGEEMGVFGGNAYADAHASEVNNHIFAFESDLGTFTPYGFGFTGGDNAFNIVSDIAQTLLAPINCTTVRRGGGGADISRLMQGGVPGASPLTADSRYFFYHHSVGDSMTVQDPNDMDLNVVSIATLIYTLADMNQTLPRN